jgi:hypothetical protein
LSEHPWRRILVVLLMAVSACTREAGTRSSSPSASPATTLGPASSSPTTSDGARYPNLSSFTDPFDRFAYKSAYSDCGLIGLDKTADAFGGEPNDPTSVARTYAVAVFPESEEPREATFRGCLDAFETGTDT